MGLRSFIISVLVRFWEWCIKVIIVVIMKKEGSFSGMLYDYIFILFNYGEVIVFVDLF